MKIVFITGYLNDYCEEAVTEEDQTVGHELLKYHLYTSSRCNQGDIKGGCDMNASPTVSQCDSRLLTLGTGTLEPTPASPSRGCRRRTLTARCIHCCTCGSSGDVLQTDRMLLAGSPWVESG